METCAIGPTAVYNSCCCAPIRWICDKITKIAEAIFGYLVRVTTFQLGVINNWFAFRIMRVVQFFLSDPREEKPFDPKRLEASKQFLIRFGGVESIVHPADRGAEIHCMTFKSADFFRAFHDIGCDPVDIIYNGERRKVFLNPPPEVKKFYFPMIQVQSHDDIMVPAALLPESPAGNGPHPLILHCQSPGRSMCMDRRFIGLHLAAGYDVAMWDPRGTAESTGTPSEGGHYLDAEAVYQHVLDQGYPHNRIYVSGFCKGAACAAHLKKKFHHEGVHFIASNPYSSYAEALNNYGFIGQLGTRYGLSAIQDPSLPVVQDSFDNVNKLSHLPHSRGRFVLIDTDTDTMMPEGSVDKMIEAIGIAGPVFRHTRKHPDPTANGHLQPPYEDPNVWKRYVEFVT